MTGSSLAAADSAAVLGELRPSLPLAGHAILTIDATGAVTSCNEHARKLFAIASSDEQVRAADLVGPPVGAPGGVRTLLDGFAATPDRPPAWTGHLLCLRGPGRRFAVTATASRHRSGAAGGDGLIVACGLPPDVTTSAASWLPPDYSRQIGHELRGCLTGIAGLAAALARHADRTTTGAGDMLRRLRMIEQSARTGIATVDTLVELTQLDSGRIRCHRVTVEIQQIVAAAVGMCAAITGQAQRVTAESAAGPILVRTDPVLAKPVVAELITNALVAGSATDVRVRAVAREDTALIEVTDDGCGIAPEEQAAIFEPFVRGESAADGTAGLGLHLARRRAQLIGAGLTVRSRRGSGSTFTLALPIQQDQIAVTQPTCVAGSGK